MKLIYFNYSFSITFLILSLSFLATAQDNVIGTANIEVKGILLDAQTQAPLPYANLVIERINRGGITNENGQFSMDTTGLMETDSITFLYIGYKTKKVAIEELANNSTVYIKEDIKNLNKVFVFSSPPNAKDIVKKVMENKDKNYKASFKKEQVFIRARDIEDINDYELKYKKSTISQLDEKMIQEMEDKTPRHHTSYSDVLTDIYYSGNKSDSQKVKAKPVKFVRLKEKDIGDLDAIEEAFEEVFTGLTEKEYWKFKTGIISAKLDSSEMDAEPDTTKPKNSVRDWELKSLVLRAKNYTSLNNSKQWEFLHSPGKYKYELVGGTNVGPEDVYVIDFTPKSGGLYIGRMYVSVSSYALIRADYQYDVGKTGMDIHLFGFGYTENNFVGSVLFEKVDSTYELKYCSRKQVQTTEVDRNFSLIKKRERFLLDKTLKEIKIGLVINVQEEGSFEFLVLSREDLDNKTYKSVETDKYIPVTYVDQFDASLWEGYSVIEPTKQMRDYKKKD